MLLPPAVVVPDGSLALSDMTLTRGYSRASLFLSLTNTNSVVHPAKERLNTGESSTPHFAPAMGLTPGAEGRSEGTALSTLDLHPRSCQGQRRRNGKELWAPWTVANAAWGHLAEGTGEQRSCEDDDNQRMSSLTAGVTGTVLSFMCRILFNPFPRTDYLCLRKSPPFSELWLFPLQTGFKTRWSPLGEWGWGKALLFLLPVELS